MAASAREFFETLEARADPAKTRGMSGSWRFDVEPAGSWVVRVTDGALHVDEGPGAADCTITTSEGNFLKILSGEQNPMTAYMTGKLRIAGDLGTAMKLQKLF
jgi:putative sterol carrier protein